MCCCRDLVLAAKAGDGGARSRTLTIDVSGGGYKRHRVWNADVTALMEKVWRGVNGKKAAACAWLCRRSCRIATDAQQLSARGKVSRRRLHRHAIHQY